jgi:glucose/arabinose dehydrogenase
MAARRMFCERSKARLPIRWYASGPQQVAPGEGRRFAAARAHMYKAVNCDPWNRLVFIPYRDGSPAGEPAPFLSGLVPNPAGSGVYGHPVGVAVDQAGSLLISDDGQKLISKVSYELASADPATGSY